METNRLAELLSLRASAEIFRLLFGGMGEELHNRVYYLVKTENPLYPEIRNLVLKTSGLTDVLKSALADKRIRVAFVFGSVAHGEEKAGSDVDLMVIGQLGLRDLSGLLFGIEEKIECEVNSYVLHEAEFRKCVRTKEHFVSRVMELPKIFITGSQHELETMGR
jgi:predicted nucleotidyltransferase